MPRPAALAAAGSALAVLTLAVSRLPAQTRVELQAHGLGTWATSSFVGGGLGVAWRATGRERVALSVSAGSRDGALAGRGELLAAYYLSPALRRGLSPYGAAGIAVQAARNVTGGWSGPQGDLVLVLGVESRPGAGSGWFVEGGVGGGVRLALGLRWRHRRG